MDDILVFVLVLIVLNVAVRFCDAGNSSYVIYPGSDTANITCYGHGVINITRTELRNVPTKCEDTVCNLSEDDKKYIYNTCDGTSSCEVSLKNMNPCISRTGFINVNYTCQRDMIKCDFESGTCGFVNQISNDGWSRVESRTRPPWMDHTSGSGNGHHFYVFTGTRKQSLKSSELIGNTKQCLSFYYWINYSDDSMELYIYSLNETSTALNSWKIQTFHNDYIWEKKTIPLEYAGDYSLVFEASGKTYDSRFAIDDITITNTDCEAVKECDFELNTCGWNGHEKWTRRIWSTSTWNTWPKRHYSTTSGEGYYVYLDTSNLSRSNFTSPSFTKRGDLCFVLWYYMNGYQIRNLNVYYKSESGHSLHLRAISGDQKQVWLSAHIDISTTENFNIILEGQRGSRFKSYIVIDDMSLLPGKCTGYIQHQKICTSVEEIISLDQCHYKDQSLEHMHIYFDPTTEDCREYLEVGADTICLNSGYYKYCDAHSIVEQKPSCIALNRLIIDYTCEVKPVIEQERDKDSDDTGMIVGVIGGILLIAGLTFSVLFIIYRRQKQPNTPRSTTVNDYTVSWDSDENAMNLPSMMKAHSDNRGFNKAVHSDMQHYRATSNPTYTQEYEYTSSAVVINASDLDFDNAYMNTPSQQNNKFNINNFGLKCTRKRHEYNKTNQVYDLASAITQTVEDDYAESDCGQYDISGNSRHRMKDTIYDHSIDGMYDSSHRGRHLSTEDDTYDHTFGKQTEDEYDLAQS